MPEAAFAVLVGAAGRLHDAVQSQERSHHQFLIFLVSSQRTGRLRKTARNISGSWTMVFWLFSRLPRVRIVNKLSFFSGACEEASDLGPRGKG